MRYLIFLASFCSFVSINKAETTKGNINVLFANKQNISFVLFDSVNINCGKIEGELISMALYLPSTKEYFDGIKRLKKGDALIDSNGKKIGEVISDSIQYSPLGSAKTNTYLLRISGFIHPNDVQSTTVPEYELEKNILQNKNNLLFIHFQHLISEFKFEKTTYFSSFGYPNSYLLRYDSYLGHIRIFLVFKRNQLVAILHDRELKDLGLEDIKLETINLLWVSGNADKKKKFINRYKEIYESGD